MTDPLQTLLQGVTKQNLFPPNSRYSGIDTGKFVAPDGRSSVYIRRRVVPPPERFSTIQEYTVRQGDRLDNVSAQLLGDPEVFWRLCDSNAAIRPEELIETAGRVLRITLPEGIPGTQP